MKVRFLLLFALLLISKELVAKKAPLKFFPATHSGFQYTGRIDFSNKSIPRFWQPGVYIKTKFKGSECEILLNDEILWGKSHNYISVVVDNGVPMRIQTHQAADTIRVQNLSRGYHTLTICKSTEAGIGYVEFIGLRCQALQAVGARPVRKIEFFGNSITCGTGSDLSAVLCEKGEWYDQHNAFESYGPTTARTLNAQWHLSSVSGIGLIHSCCDMEITMPDVYDKINMRDNNINWSFEQYQPDVVTVALGQNDGIRDSLTFCGAYVKFIQVLRSKYPAARIVCLTSPMADAALVAAMKKYLTGVVSYLNAQGDQKVSQYFFSRSFNSGCGGHPDLKEHQLIAAELSAYIKKLMNW
jgi:hypothetical protein